MKTIVKFAKSDRNRLRLLIGDRVLMNKIVEKFTVPNPVYKYYKFSPKFLSAISPTKSFYNGLVYDVISFIKSLSNEYDVEFDLSQVIDVVMPMNFKATKEELAQPENEKFKYRDYQEEAIIKGLRYGRGCFVLPTASGKSLVIYGLIKNIWKFKKEKKRILLFVPGIQLVEQMAKDFIEYGCDPNDIVKFAAKKSKKDKIVIGNESIIISNREWLRTHGNELPKDIDTVIVDEVHSLADTTSKATKFIRKLSARSVFGLTGTMPNDKNELWTVIGATGKILMDIRPSEFQDKGHICEVDVTVIKVNHGVRQPEPPNAATLTDPLDYAKALYPAEWAYIENCNHCISLISSLACKKNDNTIILFDHKDHGNRMFSMAQQICSMKNLDKKLFFIDGEVDLDDREDIRSAMESNNNVVLFANSGCFRQGINIKNVHNIVFAFSSGRKSTKIIQAIGRGLRKMDGKTRMRLYDIYHNFKYSKKHFGERLALYKENYTLDKVNFLDYNVKK